MLTLFFFGVFLVPALAALTPLARRLGLLPGGVSGWVAAPLLFAASMSVLASLLWYGVAIDWPARLQRQLLGEQAASAFALSYISFQDGLPDQAFEWRYELSDRTRQRLARRCRTPPQLTWPEEQGGCELAFDARTSEWHLSARLANGRLIMTDTSF